MNKGTYECKHCGHKSKIKKKDCPHCGEHGSWEKISPR
jgi:ribosomal protein L37E